MAEDRGVQRQRRESLRGPLVAIAAAVSKVKNPDSSEAVFEAAATALAECGAPTALLDSVAALAEFAMSPVVPNACPLEEEAMAASCGRRAMLPLEQDRLQHRIEAIEHETRGLALCPEAGCGRVMHSVGRRNRTLIGCHGAMTVSLQWRACSDPKCHYRVAPAAKAVGIGEHKFTPRVNSMITLASTTLPYGKAVDLVATLTDVDVSEREAQVLTMERGQRLCEADAADAKRFAHSEANGLPRVCGRPKDAVPATEIPEIAYIEVDGVIPMTREQLPGTESSEPGARGGKGRRYRLEGREVKNAVLYSGNDAMAEMPSRGCLLKRTYVSHLGHWESFAMQVWLAMLRLRFDQAKLLVVIGDGAAWITALAQTLPSRTKVVQILDLYHVNHRIWEVAHAIWGNDSAAAAAHARLWIDSVEQGGALDLARELRSLNGLSGTARTKVDEMITYLDNNHKHMDYPSYRSRGLRTSSASVESGNFHVTGARLKQQGMRWSVAGAERLAALRADYANGNWLTRSKLLLAA